jgi:hypothetical protein
MKKSNLLLATLLATSTGLTAFSQDTVGPDTLDIKKKLSIEGIFGRNMGFSAVVPAQIGNYPFEMHAGVTTNLPNSSMFGDTKGNLVYFRAGLRTKKVPLPYIKEATAYAGLDAYMGSNTQNICVSPYVGLQAILNHFKNNHLSGFAEFHQLIGRQNNTIQREGLGFNIGFRATIGP